MKISEPVLMFVLGIVFMWIGPCFYDFMSFILEFVGAMLFINGLILTFKKITYEIIVGEDEQ